MEPRKSISIKSLTIIGLLVFCLFENWIRHFAPGDSWGVFELLLTPKSSWMMFVLCSIWCFILLALTFQKKDFWLLMFLTNAVVIYFLSYVTAAWDGGMVTLLCVIAVSRGILLLGQREFTLCSLMVLLSFSTFWHFDSMNKVFLFPRWTGLWGDPNVFGMLMGVGLMLAVGLLLINRSAPETNNNWRSFFLWVIVVVAGTGLFFSYCRGAWFAVAMGFVYLKMMQGKLKWHIVLLGLFLILTVLFFFWHGTSDNAPWFIKRLDFSRPSVQHRIAAWHGAMQIIRDHPFGVGWNYAVQTYDEHYSPPPDGANAITSNSYLLLAVQLGFSALFFWGVYVWMVLSKKTSDGVKIVCRSSVVVLLTAFFFDGGLFELPTASVFWILLEFGASKSKEDSSITFST